jgi:hypothetical protein
MANPADPLHVSGDALPALNDVELSTLIEIGSAGGMWPRHKLDPAAVRVLLERAAQEIKAETSVDPTPARRRWRGQSIVTGSAVDGDRR